MAITKIRVWEQGVKALVHVALRYPHTAYAAFVFSLQAEWQHLCRLCPSAETHLAPVEEAIRLSLIPAIVGLEEPVDDNFQCLLAHGVKQGGLAIRNPCKAAPILYQTLKAATEILVTSLLNGESLDSQEHCLCIRAASKSAQESCIEQEESFCLTLGQQIPKIKKHLGQMDETGAWLSIMPSWFDRTQLTLEEWHNNIALRFGR